MSEHSSTQQILLAHGGGGQLSEELIRQTVLPRIQSSTDTELNDAACISVGNESVFMTTDSFVVKPLFFPGGDIGKLAVCGTVNDLAVAGAEPLALSLGLIIEEGFPTALLEKILDSIGKTALESGVNIVTGDTKTVDAGAADGVFINTTGIGRRRDGSDLGFHRIETGDKILISGTLGDHGMTIMSLREDLQFRSELESDCACLAGLIADLFATGADLKFLRDPTRGGMAASLNEVARSTGRQVLLHQTEIPISPVVQSAADMLGLDVLNIANEGKFVAIVKAEHAEQCLACCHAHDLGKDAAIIGEVGPQNDVPIVELETQIGGRRVVQMPYGRDLPRIC